MGKLKLGIRSLGGNASLVVAVAICEASDTSTSFDEPIYVCVCWWRRCRAFAENFFVLRASAAYLSLRFRFKLKIPHLLEIFKLILYVVRRANKVERSSFFAASVCLIVWHPESFHIENVNLLAAGKAILLSLKVSHTFSYWLILEYFSAFLFCSHFSFLHLFIFVLGISVRSVAYLDNNAKMYISRCSMCSLRKTTNKGTFWISHCWWKCELWVDIVLLAESKNVLHNSKTNTLRGAREQECSRTRSAFDGGQVCAGRWELTRKVFDVFFFHLILFMNA